MTQIPKQDVWRLVGNTDRTTPSISVLSLDMLPHRLAVCVSIRHIDLHIGKNHQHHILNIAGCQLVLYTHVENQSKCPVEIGVHAPVTILLIGSHCANHLRKCSGAIQVDPTGTFAESHDSPTKTRLLGNAQTQSNSGIHWITIHRTRKVRHRNKVSECTNLLASVCPLKILYRNSLGVYTSDTRCRS